MKEDLHMVGNDYNFMTTYWTIGYILGFLPSQIMLTKIRPSIWLPSMELLWSVLVLGMSGSKNTQTLFALRFFQGFFEASAYPGIMTLLGNWYTPAELGKRSCIFVVSSSCSSMFGGYLQAALYKGMNGKGGLASWRWLFIFDGILGVPVALYGFWAIPDNPYNSVAYWLKPTDRTLAIKRMEDVGRAPAKPLTFKSFVNVFKSWPAWVFPLAFIFHSLAVDIYGYFGIYLKSTGKYSVEQVNLIPTAGYGAQIIFTLTYAWTRDAIRMRWPVIFVAGIVALIGTIILSVWPSDNIPAMMAGWILTYCETGAGALFMTWINEVCGHSATDRMVVIGWTETMAFTFNAWIPLIIYNTTYAPRFPYGYQLSAMFFALVSIMALVIGYLSKRYSPREKWEREQATLPRNEDPVES